MADTLFEKYGGFKKFQSITRNFYSKVLDSDLIKHYFDSVCMESIIDHQARFLSFSLGGPEGKYADIDFRAIHAGLAITEQEFIEAAELLAESLEDAEVEDDDIEKIMLLVATLKDQIVSG